MSDIDLPIPMTPEERRAIQVICLESRLFAYGPNDWGTACGYEKIYSGFTVEQYAIFMYSNGMTPKQYRNMLKKLCRKSKELTISCP